MVFLGRQNKHRDVDFRNVDRHAVENQMSWFAQPVFKIDMLKIP